MIGEKRKKHPSDKTGGKAWIQKLSGMIREKLGAVDMKKMIAGNIPYVICFYLVDKVAWLYRHCVGGSMVQKLGAVFLNFSLAFENPVLSFSPYDIGIGVAGAVILKAAVYYKRKSAKKFRQGEEYGSARWGNAKDIEPYIDPIFENNIPLTQTERLTMASRPKKPQYARNKNIMVIGGSGSGKTRFFVKPSLMQMHSSYVVTDPKGRVMVG